jgi:hypothetical protein
MAGGGNGTGAAGPKLRAAMAGGGNGTGAAGPKLRAAMAGGGNGTGAAGPNAKADVNGIITTAATAEIERTDSIDIELLLGTRAGGALGCDSSPIYHGSSNFALKIATLGMTLVLRR